MDGFACSEVGGNLTIAGDDIVSLTPLSSLTSVGGDLFIGYIDFYPDIRQGNPALETLEGLEGLTSIGGALVIVDNPMLTSLGALSRLTSVGYLWQGHADSYVHTSVSILSNTSLASLEGLEGLNSLDAGLAIEDNSSLSSLEDLEGLSHVGGVLSITGSPLLTSLAGLEGLSSLRGLSVGYNGALVSLAGLEGLSSLGGSLSIYGNASLTSLAGLEALSSIGGALRIYDSPALTSLEGLDGLTSIGYEVEYDYDYEGETFTLVITGNPVLASLEGLSGLTSVGYGQFLIQNNASLESLAGLEGVTSGGRAFQITDNASLTSLKGLEGLTAIGGVGWDDFGLIIKNNALLASLHGLENLTSSSSVFIEGNPALVSLDGLSSLTSVTRSLWITNNPVLTSCSCGLAGLVSDGAFTGVLYGSNIRIENNAPESSGGRCSSPEQVLATPCEAEPGDSTPPVCGAVDLVTSGGHAIAVEVSPSDTESGIRKVAFPTLANATALLDGTVGPFSQGQLHVFNVPYPASFTMRADKTDPAARSSVVIEVTNGAGLTSTCDPVLQTLTAGVPEAFALEQNYPNPFNPSTAIRFSLPEAGPVELAVYDAMGRRVATLVDERMEAGTYEAAWDGRRDSGGQVAGGLYFYTLRAGTFRMTRSMVLLK